VFYGAFDVWHHKAEVIESATLFQEARNRRVIAGGLHEFHIDVTADWCERNPHFLCGILHDASAEFESKKLPVLLSSLFNARDG
jgi:hypothetical protein